MISLPSQGLSRVFSSTTFPVLSFVYSPNLTSIHNYWQNHSFDSVDACWQSDVSAFYTRSRFAIAFLPRSKSLLILCLQSPSAVILEPKKIQPVTTSCEMPGWMNHKLESRLPGEIPTTSDMQMTPPLWQKVKRSYRASR